MKKNKDLESEYKKGRIIEFSKYNEEELKKHFSRARYGTIIQSYPSLIEEKLYLYLFMLLKRKYPEFCDKKEVMQTLSSYGHIYTAKLEKKMGNAIYIENSADILLYSFLNEIDEDVIHELIHKLGFLKFDESFYNMPEIYWESGTELITNTIFDNPLCREMIVDGVWGRTVGVQPTYMIETILVSQLNTICEGNLLEKSNIQGKNFFEPELINLLGEKEYAFFFGSIKEICRLEKKYWKIHENNSKRLEIKDKISDFQNSLLEIAFTKKLEQVKTPEEAEEYLQGLMKFSDYRIKFENETDKFFTEFFQAKKHELEIRYEREYNIEDIQSTWFDRYPAIKLDEAKENRKEEQKAIIDEMAGVKKPLFGRKRKKELPSPIDSKAIPEYLYKVDIDFSKFTSEDDSKNPIRVDSEKSME